MRKYNVKFIKATNLDKTPKDVGEHLLECPLGRWLYGNTYIIEGCPILFEYADDSELMLHSSTIQNVEKAEVGNLIKYKITTRNTIYYFDETIS